MSDAFKERESRAAETHILYDEFVHEIAHKLKEGDLGVVERALFKAGITSNRSPLESAHIVNEFLVFLTEQTRPMEAGEA